MGWTRSQDAVFFRYAKKVLADELTAYKAVNILLPGFEGRSRGAIKARLLSFVIVLRHMEYRESKIHRI